MERQAPRALPLRPAPEREAARPAVDRENRLADRDLVTGLDVDRFHRARHVDGTSIVALSVSSSTTG